MVTTRRTSRSQRIPKKQTKSWKKPKTVKDTNKKFPLADDERLKSIVIGKPLEERFYEDYKEAPDGETVVDLNKEEKDYFNLIAKSMEFQLKWLQKEGERNLNVKSSDDILDGYKSRKPSFSIVAPAKEKIRMKICHGSHRINYGDGTSGIYRKVHRSMITEVSVPENCMIIMDERLLHAGCESYLCGYTPTHSPRYCAYVHHRDKVPDRGYSFNNVSICDKTCEFCSYDETKGANTVISKSMKALETYFYDRYPDGGQNDLLSGDLHVLGWMIVKNGVQMTTKMEQRLAHEFQTILLTKEYSAQSKSSAWKTITNSLVGKQVTIPDTFRAYMFAENDRKKRKNSCLIYGSRRMFPYFEEKYVDNLSWLRNNYCRNIASFFEEIERKLVTIRFECYDSDDENEAFEGNNISRLMGNEEMGCEDYVFSGQCIVANFGFVREQQMHMAFDPSKK